MLNGMRAMDLRDDNDSYKRFSITEFKEIAFESHP